MSKGENRCQSRHAGCHCRRDGEPEILRGNDNKLRDGFHQGKMTAQALRRVTISAARVRSPVVLRPALG
jgi:hypothetical protein